jgi:hypothetical protein
MNTTTLSQYNWQRGTLHYMAPDGYTTRQMQGWFMLSTDGRTVIARKVRGRNVWQFASTEQVINFNPYEKAGNK